MVVRRQEFLGNNNIVNSLVGEGLHLGGIQITVNIDTLGFLGKDYGNVEALRHDTGNADTGSLNGKNFIDGLIRKQPFELLSHFVKQLHIHLVV